MRLIYTGEAPARTIVIPGGVIPCERGVPFDVPDDIGESLLDQDIYEPAPVAVKKEKS
jgi:hypothetical protein